MRLGWLIRWLIWRSSNARAITDREAERRVARGEFESEGTKVSGAANWVLAILALLMAALFVLAMMGY